MFSDGRSEIEQIEKCGHKFVYTEKMMGTKYFIAYGRIYKYIKQ